ncbi:TolC family protein [Mucilaginibacter sp. Bleaf8]|uniref:TolC family protein n=1 Tax=Mucilaginibacter sp. Bleaf8 TaxID=2834430 RepID=UPI001BCA6DAC|nr:TolC family protein [Mucilaginibacter sp. Bleaf8]MBS7562813.1 TolC family protein [Mucilaginibacter sp. Bleaf8]
MKFKLICYGVIGCLLLLVWGGKVSAQAKNNKAQDTSKTFALKDFEELVFKNHPIVKQAALLSEAARANVLQSLGYFDPALKAAFGRKLFGESEYYNHWTSELKVPLWVAGADLKVGYDRNVGEYTNPETHTSLSGLTGIGLSIPLGQGLIIDARRSTLRQSRIMVGYAEAERVKQINGVWYNAIKDYWNWYYMYRQFELINEGVRLAEQRYRAVSGQTEVGDKPGIDSVEANITVQDRRIQLEKVKIELQNARLVLSNHLWNDQGNPLELPVDAVPQSAAPLKVDRQLVDTLVTQAANLHPELVKLRAKSGQLAIERSYRREMLKPKINISGSLLSKRRSFNTYVPDYYDFGWSNYKVGLEFSFPLFLRAERGKLREVKIKQEQLDFDLQQSGRVIQNEVLASYNDLKAYESQLAIQIKNIGNQQILLTGESQKFDLGESTLFLINSRESKLIDMKIKREEMIAGFQKALAGLYYKAGTRQNVE